ncbi:hypothetical protein KY330_05310 [Candidatus Woesearchaeota archaeon]|nr:hypothetical protein [Candidatus Woesearchaeota archaeon]
MKKIFLVVFIVSLLLLGGCGHKFTTIAQAKAECKDAPDYEHCLKDVGIRSFNYGICKIIEHEERRAKCIVKIAIKARDDRFCKELPELMYVQDADASREYCYEKAGNDLSGCGDSLQPCCFGTGCETADKTCVDSVGHCLTNEEFNKLGDYLRVKQQ